MSPCPSLNEALQQIMSNHYHPAPFTNEVPSSETRVTSEGFSEVGLGISRPLEEKTFNRQQQSSYDGERDSSHTSSLFSPESRQQPDASSEPKATPSGAGLPANSSPWFMTSQTVLLGNDESTPDNHHNIKCPTRRSIVQRSLSWLPVVIIALAIYSTILSGLYLVVAVWKPRFGKEIATGGSLSPSTANLLSALFAKTIELSFVTVFVSFLGQVLSRRAITKGSRGITIADMNMRAWIMQPGSLITNWETVRYSAWTILGALTLMASFVAMFYTTAAEALVSPKLVMGPLESRLLQGQVYTKFANPVYLSDNCKTPITAALDPLYRGTTCLQIEHVGQAFHNYQEYIGTWANMIAAGNSTSTTLALRPKPHGAMFDNTTVTGSWIETTNMTELSIKYGRMVNNITSAMPHTGVLAAAQDPVNEIRQPNDLDGQGKYVLEASVPSPAVNVLCVGMSEDEVAPLIYTKWPGTSGEFDATTWYSNPPAAIPVYPDWLNRTVVDELFGFGEKYGQRPPVFPKLPQPYNTILNTTTGLYGTNNAIYILGASPPGFTPEYVLCSLKAKQTGLCSTRYEVTTSGGKISTDCEIPSNDLQYDRRIPNVPETNWVADWTQVAAEWANALNLGSGITDSAASNARLLMQMTPQFNNKTNISSLDPKLPSMSEALAVMAGCTLLLSSRGGPFVTFWNYSTDSLNESVYQSFNATLRGVGYASGGTAQWQGVFYVILTFAFLANITCLAFMLFEVRGKPVTDFTEPQNLFAIAMNSPPTSRLQGACGGGPQGRQLKERWYIGMEEDDDHYYVRSKTEENIPSKTTPRCVKSYDNKHGRYMECFETEETTSININPVSPTVEEFRSLSRRGTFFSRFY